MIAIDTQTVLAKKTGFGNYVDNLTKELARLNSEFNYCLIPAEKNNDLSAPQRFLRDQYEFPKKARENKADLVHQPAFSAPLFVNAKVVVTAHDLIARFFGEDIPFWARQYFARWIPFTIKRANHIIAISEHTKKDLIAELRIPSEKISVIYEAAGDEFRPDIDPEKVLELKSRLKLTHPYLAHIGTLEPRKNLLFLVEAFSEVVKRRSNIQLVLAGKKGWDYEKLFSKVSELGLEQRVIFTGYLSDEDRPVLLRGALALVFPSLYEGFGLPPLEAMAAGTPVIASNSSSIPEVVGEAGLLAHPKDKDKWIKLILELIERPDSGKKLREAGLQRASQFSWRKTAEQTADVYRMVLKL